MKKYHISFEGRTLETDLWTEVSEEERKELYDQYFSKPHKSEVIKQMKKINKDGVVNDKITRFYFRELMAKTQSELAKWTVEEVFLSKDLLGVFKAKTQLNKNVFPEDQPLIKNIETAIRLGGSSYAKIPTQFPIKAANEILDKYNINNNFYDFSCGWGIRLLSALKHNINYYGTDPNDKLCLELENLTQDWKNNIENNSEVKIYPQGSEIFIPELKNKIGLAFSSPPYFSLEDYKIGNQSWKKGIDYKSWLQNYLYPTLVNCINYLIINGILAINIKNTSVPIATDVNNFLKDKLTFIETIPLKNIKRLKSTGDLNISTDELIYIYRRDYGTNSD